MRLIVQPSSATTEAPATTSQKALPVSARCPTSHRTANQLRTTASPCSLTRTSLSCQKSAQRLSSNLLSPARTLAALSNPMEA
uniref:Uncharacterized protein n=1 Tax=Macrostomum lignano TaxID=282301 RepID=A0A1I8J3V4_9PLAT